jgi:hypothetical protein
MAFDEQLAERIRGSLGRRKGLAEKKMFTLSAPNKPPRK